ncbi:MAG: sigma-70 family RNA polymerase sigma factor, partial [Bifidobacteriaceae bacterium]|nr:sigma-70 family RNA polymerase sigma factor [Bifidobacteriaceae bacterium]
APEGRPASPDPKLVNAFTALYRDHYARLVAFAHRRLGTADQAEDCVAEVFRIAWEVARRTQDPATVLSSGWLFAATRNVIAHQWRSAGRAVELARAYAVELDRQTQSDCPEGCHQSLLDALAELPADQRELLIARYWDGLTASEAGCLLGISPGAARVRTHRARAALKRLLPTPKE